MNCQQTSRAHAYHDGELSPADAREFEAHLQECDACRERLEELRDLSRAITTAQLTPMPLAVSQRLENAWSTARDRGVMRIAGWMTAAAAAVLIGALSLWPRDGTDTVSPWQSAAVMPPVESTDEAAIELVATQWIANDLSLAEAVNR